VNMLFLIAAISSPLIWSVAYVFGKRPGSHVFFFWLILYAGMWIWLTSSPEFRFGNAYMSLSIFFPLLFITYNRQMPRWMSGRFILLLIFAAACLNYLYGSYELRNTFLKKYQYAFTGKNWFYPLKDYHTTIQNDKTTFPYKVLLPGTKLYLSDSAHDCLNADLPCLIWNNGEIEMRGSRIETGFRNSKCYAWKNFPYL